MPPKSGEIPAGDGSVKQFAGECRPICAGSGLFGNTCLGDERLSIAKGTKWQRGRHRHPRHHNVQAA
jgi:hypothetical protein